MITDTQIFQTRPQSEYFRKAFLEIIQTSGGIRVQTTRLDVDSKNFKREVVNQLPR